MCFAALCSTAPRKVCVLLHFARQHLEKHNVLLHFTRQHLENSVFCCTLLDNTSKTSCLAALCSTTLRKHQVLLHFARQHLENTSSDSLIFPSKSLFEVTVRSHCTSSNLHLENTSSDSLIFPSKSLFEVTALLRTRTLKTEF